MADKTYQFKCNDNCGIIEFTKFDDGDQTMLYYALGFYVYQSHFWRRLKLLWSILRGKEYELYEVIVPKSRVEEFKKFVNEV